MKEMTPDELDKLLQKIQDLEGPSNDNFDITTFLTERLRNFREEDYSVELLGHLENRVKSWLAEWDVPKENVHVQATVNTAIPEVVTLNVVVIRPAPVGSIHLSFTIDSEGPKDLPDDDRLY